MWQRFTDACGRTPTPQCIIKLAETGIQQSGLSKRKAEYILDLAVHFAEKKVRPAAWRTMTDEAVIADLCAIRGIGRWTAEMRTEERRVGKECVSTWSVRGSP